MASVNQLISEFAHSLGQPNNYALRENIRSLIHHTRNEVIRRSYENHSYVDKILTQRFKVSLIDVPDGEVPTEYISEVIDVPGRVDIQKIVTVPEIAFDYNNEYIDTTLDLTSVQDTYNLRLDILPEDYANAIQDHINLNIFNNGYIKTVRSDGSKWRFDYSLLGLPGWPINISESDEEGSYVLVLPPVSKDVNLKITFGITNVNFEIHKIHQEEGGHHDLAPAIPFVRNNDNTVTFNYNHTSAEGYAFITFIGVTLPTRFIHIESEHLYTGKLIYQVEKTRDKEVYIPPTVQEVKSTIDGVPRIKRTAQKVPRPIRLTNNLPFDRVSSVGYKTNREFPYIKETSARFRSMLPGMTGMPAYDYINEYIYIFPANNRSFDLQKLVIESAFERPTEIQIANGEVNPLDVELYDNNEWLLSEDMIGQIKDIIYKRDLLSTVRETNEIPNTIKFNQ